MSNTPSLIDSLVDDLNPVRPLRWRAGAGLVAAAFAATVAAVWLLAGFRAGLTHGQVSELFLITDGLMLVVGSSAAAAVIAMASPRVGSTHDNPKWAMAALALLPLSALLVWLAPPTTHPALYQSSIDLHCVAWGSASAALIAVALGWWLRRGAPVAPKLAGLYLGVASGALGMAAYGLACPDDQLFHLGIWHVIPVVLLGLLGRFAGPAIIRW
ncbi:NrsF family protein [Tsuneonella mangrovi]|uniref:NrsF family protein n=1 Tax=Tsuneonella mangrovi TaxID=1982042 RepID=UPI000BA2073B|nr:DUF1109 domain-containing protein [Tsuneonella mangrovi]